VLGYEWSSAGNKSRSDSGTEYKVNDLLLWTVVAVAAFLVLLVPANYLLSYLLVRDPSEVWGRNKISINTALLTVMGMETATVTGSSSNTFFEKVYSDVPPVVDRQLMGSGAISMRTNHSG
jgi:hypothetical protein